MENMKLTREGPVAVVTFDRPPVNAVDISVLEEALGLFASLEEDGSVRAVVLTGSGPCFSAGLDLKVIPGYSPGQQRDLIDKVNRVILALYRFPKPFVGAINGHALAGGLFLAITPDYRVGAAGSYELGATEVRAGLPFPISTVESLLAEVTRPWARRMLLTGNTLSPEQALEAGVLDELTPQGKLADRAVALAAKMAEFPPSGYATIKMQLRGATIRSIERVMEEGDPLLEQWAPPESVGGAAMLLGRERGVLG